MTKYKSCQSCGMPLSKDGSLNGKEKGGEVSDKYCKYCYSNGEFNLEEEINTAEKMQKMCIKKMKRGGVSGIIAWIFTRGIPKLERWKNKK